MNIKYIILTIILFLINNIAIWYQLNGQLVWDFWKSPKGIITSLLLGIPITAGFWLCTKWGYLGFGNLWAVRWLGFGASMITIPIMSYFYLGEPMTLKVWISLILAIIIMLLQLI